MFAVFDEVANDSATENPLIATVRRRNQRGQINPGLGLGKMTASAAGYTGFAV
jgi:hypothetical protein